MRRVDLDAAAGSPPPHARRCLRGGLMRDGGGRVPQPHGPGDGARQGPRPGLLAAPVGRDAAGELLAVAGYLVTMFGDLVIQWVALRASSRSLDDEMAAKLDGDRACTCAPEDSGLCKCGAVQIPEERAALVHRTSVGDALLLILALCFHSIFEGIAIGVSDTKADAWKALWTISLHKIFAAIAMGIALLRILPNRPFLSCLAYAFAFAISTPIGVAIGIIIDSTSEGPTADWIYAISMGFAAGVFIYVAINHLLAKGYNHLLAKGYNPPSPTALDRPFYKYLAVVAGAATLAIVMIWDT
jgi:zinc transporter 1/2/3